MKKGTLSAMVFALLPGLLAWNAMAASPPGTVNFRGELLGPPCKLAPGADGEDVKVDFGPIDRRDIGEVEIKRTFELRFVECRLLGLEPAITFSTPAALAEGGMRPEGDTNVVLHIDGVTFNEKRTLPSFPREEASMVFTTRLTKDAAGTKIRPGVFSAVVGLTVTWP